jgi:hypothetical protein
VVEVDAGLRDLLRSCSRLNALSRRGVHSMSTMFADCLSLSCRDVGGGFDVVRCERKGGGSAEYRLLGLRL